MRRTTFTLLFLLNVLATACAAGSVDWSRHIVPKPYDAAGQASDGTLLWK